MIRNELDLEKFFIDEISSFFRIKNFIFYIMKNDPSKNSNLGIFDLSILLSPNTNLNFELKVLKPSVIEGYLQNHTKYADKNYRVFKQTDNILKFDNSFYVTFYKGEFTFIREGFSVSSPSLLEAFVQAVRSVTTEDCVVYEYPK